MDRLWTPWRFAYVSSVAREDDEECVFCRILSEERDTKNYLLYRGKFVFIILNIFPFYLLFLEINPFNYSILFSN